jgi:hypothetical protein
MLSLSKSFYVVNLLVFKQMRVLAAMYNDTSFIFATDIITLETGKEKKAIMGINLACLAADL